ncbi:prolyl oligopeptidase family serine peptidase [Phenylobacterium sp.]|uniref:S9 family peptidase n=1 Tax=Phenylobacterium sp. TaxID=1871053 RepID=UPI0035AFCF34
MRLYPFSRHALSGAVALALLSGYGPAVADGYRTPPAPIAQIVDAPPTPGVQLSSDRRTLAILGREGLPSIAAVSEPILRLGGYRINPRTNGPVEARTNWNNGLSFKDVASGREARVALPQGLRFTQARWSPKGDVLAFVGEAPAGLELWVADVRTGQARKLTGPVLNAAFGPAFAWLPDSSGVVIRAIPAGRGAAPPAPAAPAGPIVQENMGRTAPARTYQDLLTGAHDEALFDHYFTSELVRVDLAGQQRRVAPAGVWSSVSVSPDGRFLLTERLKRPYSYVVPARAFPTEIAVLDWSGQVVKQVADRPLADDVPPPFDAVVKGPREVHWRSDAPATLVWAEAQDGGDPRNKVAIHDRLLMQDAPFTGAPRKLADLAERFEDVQWGRDDLAIVVTRWWTSRHETRLAVNPSNPGEPRVLISRSYQDQYGDPGDPMLETNAAGKPVLQFTPDGQGVFMAGAGATPKGEYPFLSRLNLADGSTRELWRSQSGWYEEPISLADAAGTRIITRRESQKAAPNFFIRPAAGRAQPTALTAFKDPAPQFAGVAKRLITYTRADGLPLSGTLYLPAGYDPKRDGPLPTLLWAYPAEFTDPKMAGQVVDKSSNRFVRPGGISHLLLVTQGYAILDNPSFPIVGENGKANDTYVEQLTADAEAAVDALVKLGVAERGRIAVGGHSYGAFMTANLLAHTDLFRTGIARSGAYNRTLTPFGFQAEERTYWEATDIYTKMSPFTYAPQIKEPILLTHGGADDNSGTFPVQSERFYAALKGAGATVRYVVLPNEAHGYRARESSLHTLWEMTNWLDTYLKPKAAPAKAAD